MAIAEIILNIIKSKRPIVFGISLSINFLFLSATNHPADSLLKIKPKYPNESALFIFSAGYKLPVNKNIILNSGHGAYFEAGFNPGYLISKKLLLGFYGGWAFRDGLWSTSFNSNFSNDYSTAINSEANHNQLDSTVINSSVHLMNTIKGRSIIMPGCETRSFHNYSLYFGIVIRLPYNYFPAIKFYAGSTRSYYMGNGEISTHGKDYNIFELRRAMYGGEVIVFRGFKSPLKKKEQDKRKSGNIGSLSIYYEVCDFYNSSLYFYDGEKRTNIYLKKYTSTSFLKKYRNEISFGFKFAFSIM